MADWERRYTEWADHLVTDSDTPGVAVASRIGGEPGYAGGFGHRDREAGLPVGPDTAFGIGSATKSFTAMAILQLQEQGRLSVDDPVSRHLPELRIPNMGGRTPIRIHHLLTHSSGLEPLGTLSLAMLRSLREDPDAAYREHGLPGTLETATPIDTTEELIAYLSSLALRPLGAPGEAFSYSNDSFALLGAIIERVTGTAYGAYLHEHILAPAGMTRSRLDPDTFGDDADVTVLYARGPGGEDGAAGEVRPSPARWRRPAMYAAGSLWSSANDLLRYLELYRTGGRAGGARLLTAESVRAMCGRYMPCGPGRWYGYGLMTVDDGEGPWRVGHGGASKGVAAQITLVPERDLTVAVLANLMGAPSERVATGLVRAFDGGDPARQAAPARTFVGSASETDAFVGRYGSAEGARVEVRRGCDGELTVVAGGMSLPARRIGERALAVPTQGEERVLEFPTIGGEPALFFGLRLLRRLPEEAEGTA
jgi:CubicO group peptidase (beta-lactamase class C family)